MKNNYLKSEIHSNSQFRYVDMQMSNPNDKVELPLDFSEHLQLNENLSPRLRTKSACYKESYYSPKRVLNAIEQAQEEEEKTRIRQENRKLELEIMSDDLKNIVEKRNKEIRNKKLQEKKDLETTLKNIMLDALNFSKKNSPMLSMIPNELTRAFQILQENRASTSFLNISGLSKQSNAKYDANAFLKALGVDIENLTPNNIQINVDKAYDFIRKWKVKQEEIPRIIRLKVTNEIMSVEGRRSVQKITKYSDKLNQYKEKQKALRLEQERKRREAELKKKREEEERKIKELAKQDPMERYRIESKLAREDRRKEEMIELEKENAKRRKLGKPLLEDKYERTESPILTKITITTNEEDVEIPKKKQSIIERNKSFVSNASKNLKRSSGSASIFSSHNDFRKQSTQRQKKEKNEKPIFDTFHHAEKLCSYVKSRENLKSNENIVEHLKSVRELKRLSTAARNSIDVNQIVLNDVL